MPRPLSLSELTPGRLVRLYETRKTQSGELMILTDIPFSIGNLDGVSTGVRVAPGTLGVVLGPAPEQFIVETDRQSVTVLAEGVRGWVYSSDCFDPDRT